MVIKKASIIICMLSVFFLVSPTVTWSDEPTSSLDRLVSQIEGLFPFTEGYVVSVTDSSLILDLKQGQPVKPGDHLKLIRYGKELIHPVTKEKLGRMETDLGEVKILEVRKDFSRAEVMDPTVIVKEGDGIRSSFKKVALLIAQVKSGALAEVDSDKFYLSLGEKIGRHPRFEVPDFDLGLWLLESGLQTKDLLKPQYLERLRKKVKVDYLLFSGIRSLKGKQVLQYRLTSAKNGSILKEAKILSGSLLTRTAGSRKSREQKVQTEFSPNPNNVDFVSRQVFPFEIVDFDVGDINGDGSREFVIIDSYRVRIYKFQQGKFKFITQVKINKGENRFLSVDVADINGNGKAEIFVTNKYLDQLGSFVLEAGNRGFKKLWDDVQLYFRVIHPFDNKPKLLAQKPDYEYPFQNGISILRYKNQKYVKSRKLKTPPIRGMEFIIYGLTQADVNFDKTVETIILDKDYHLRVYSPNGSLLVHSDEYYGHDPRVFDIGVDDSATLIPSTPSGSPVNSVNFRGRLLLEQNGDRKFLLVPHNHRVGGSLLQNMVVVNSSSLVVLDLDREGFSKTLETKGQKGYIAAFQVTADSKKERKIHVAIVQSGGLTKKGKSTIFTYNWTS